MADERVLMRALLRTICIGIGLLLLFTACFCQAWATDDATPSYDQTVAAGKQLMNQGKEKEAFAKALEGINQNNQRYEAYALATIILLNQGAPAEADKFLKKALEYAPADKKAKLSELAQIIDKQLSSTTASSPSKPAEDHERLRQREVLKLILADADANKGADRKPFLVEFLAKSAPFVTKYPDETNIWMLRAVAAAEVDDSRSGWEAGQKLKAFGLGDSDNPAVLKVMAALDRKGWLGDSKPTIVESFTDPSRPIIDGTWLGMVHFHIHYDAITRPDEDHDQQLRIQIDHASQLVGVRLESSTDAFLGSLSRNLRYKTVNNVRFASSAVTWEGNYHIDIPDSLPPFHAFGQKSPARFEVAADGTNATLKEDAAWPGAVGSLILKDAHIQATGLFKREPAPNPELPKLKCDGVWEGRIEYLWDITPGSLVWGMKKPCHQTWRITVNQEAGIVTINLIQDDKHPDGPGLLGANIFGGGTSFYPFDVNIKSDTVTWNQNTWEIDPDSLGSGGPNFNAPLPATFEVSADGRSATLAANAVWSNYIGNIIKKDSKINLSGTLQKVQ